MVCLPTSSVSLFLVLASAAVACGGTVDPDGFVAACAANEGLFLARGFDPAVPVDFVGVRNEATSPRVAGTGTAEPSPAPPTQGAGGVGGPNGLTTYEAAWTATLGNVRVEGELTVARTIRTRLISLPGRLVNRAGRPTLRLPDRWPWADTFTTALHSLRLLRPIPL